VGSPGGGGKGTNTTGATNGGLNTQAPTPATQVGANSTPTGPTQAQSNAILPSALSEPYQAGIQNAAQTSNYSSQSLPAAGQFQQNLYSSAIDPTAQSYLDSAAQLSGNQLAQTDAQLGGMYQNGMGSGLAPAELQAANTSSAQLGELAGQLGQQQQSLATGQLSNTFNEPNTAAAAGQTSAAGLYSMAQQAMYGDSSFPQAVSASNVLSTPSILAQPAAKGK
jgi:hypothetical protein